MRMTANAYFYIVLIVLMVVLLATAVVMPYREAKLLPLIISGTVLVMVGIGLTRELLSQPGAAATEDKASREEAKRNWRGYPVALAWICGLGLAIFLLGYAIALPLFITFYMKFLGTRWRTSVVFAVIITVVVVGGLELFPEVDLFRGLLLKRFF